MVERMRRVLFYLPVVTPWWFDNIVADLIRAAAAAAEVHVLVPPLWRNTGIGPEQLMGCATIPGISWHVADGDDHPSLRTSPADPDEIVDFVRAIDPQVTFCRSADIATPRRFPGEVRFLMEAGAPPFDTDPRWIILQRDYWHHGALDLAPADREAVDHAFAPIWQEMRRAAGCDAVSPDSRRRALRDLGLPEARPIVAVPLEYEHEEGFAAFHNRFDSNLALITYLAERLDERLLLAFTDHPLNIRHVDNERLYEAIADLGDRGHLVANPDADARATGLLIEHCDGLVVQNTKAIYAGAFFGKPTLRLSKRPSADWLRVKTDLEAFESALRAGQHGADEADARGWYGCHLLHEVLDPATISGEELLDRVDRPFARERLKGGLERLRSRRQEIGLAA